VFTFKAKASNTAFPCTAFAEPSTTVASIVIDKGNSTFSNTVCVPVIEIKTTLLPKVITKPPLFV
jgi:hypothetical protein